MTNLLPPAASLCPAPSADLHPLCLHFRKSSLEREYQFRRLSQFKKSFNALALAFTALSAVQLTLTPLDWSALCLLCSTVLLLLAILLLVNARKPRLPSESLSESGGVALPQLVRVCGAISAALVVIADNLLTLAIVDCADARIEVSPNATDSELRTCEALLAHYRVLSPPLVLLCLSLLFFLGVYLKSLLMLFYVVALQLISPAPPPLLLFLVALGLSVHFRDRHLDRVARSHFLWKSRLKVEQNDVEVMGGINKILLENILPQHVAQHFLLARVKGQLYHER